MTDHLLPANELNTWQEIAAYLGISVREAQNREKSDGMPIHRLSGKKPRVWAYRTELDAWRLRVASGHLVGASDAIRSDSSEQPETQVPSEQERVVSSPTPGNRRLFLASLTGATVVTVVGAARFLRHQRGDPMRFSTAGNKLLAWDEAGRLVWQYQFPAALREDLAGRMMRIVDLRGDGNKQVVLAASFPQGDGSYRDDLYCFSSEGRLLWQYEPELTFTFGAASFKGPWLVRDMVIAQGKSRQSIWLAVTHWQWWPAFILEIDPDGNASVKFVSAGHVYSLARAMTASGPCLLAGGVNNEYASAAMAIVREDGTASCSPQTPGSRFEYVDGPNGPPEAYFLFPPSEIAVVASKPYNRARLVQRVDDGFLVNTDELLTWGQGGSVEFEYRFSDQLEPRDVAISDGYAGWHRHFETDGLLKHSIAECPQLKGPMGVRRWDRKSGWTTISVPLASGVRPDGYRL